MLAGVADPRLVKRGVCAAGHKALYSDEWGGLPDKEFLDALDPRLADLRDRLYEKAYDATEPAGSLCAEWATKLGLPAGIPIAIGEFDVHYGAIGCGVREGTLVKVIGTSTCDCAVVSAEKPVADIPGICGIVKGAILPGFFGIEAGQSAVGDIFKWWVEVVWAATPRCTPNSPPRRRSSARAKPAFWRSTGTTATGPSSSTSGLTGLLLGQDLYTTRADIYRALIEATAFGARAIIERLQQYGVRIDRVVCTGGIAEKNPLLMQIYADVTGCAMLVAGSSQTCALGSAIAAAVLAGAHPDFASRAGGDDVAEAGIVRADRRAPGGLRPALCALPRAARQLRRTDEVRRSVAGHEELLDIKYAQRDDAVARPDRADCARDVRHCRN